MRRNRKANRPVSKPIWRKASGEDKIYFLFHNIVSMLLFFYIAQKIELFERQSYNLLDIISFSFLQFIGIVIGLTILLGILSRFLVYGTFWVINYYNNEKKKGTKITTIKSFTDMNQGINEFTTYSYIKTVIYSSIFFCIGAVVIIQVKIFNSDSFWSLIGAYLIVKLVVYLWVWARHK